MPELLPGFRYGDKPMANFSRTSEFQFHADNLRWMLQSPSPIHALSATAYGFTTQENAVAGFSYFEQAANTHWLLQQAHAPEALFKALQMPENAPPQRLGRYAESLLGFYLQRAPMHRLIAEHVSIRRPLSASSGAIGDHTTLGELDYLLQDASARFLHWELAIKFFLAEPHKLALEPQDFIGPDRKNSLHLKLEKMFTRQLKQPIPDAYLGNGAPLKNKPFGSKPNWHRQAYSRGYMFYRLKAPAQSCAALSQDHARGYWLPMSELEDLPDADYLPLPRWRWLAPAKCYAHEQPLRQTALIDALHQHWQAELVPRAVLIAELNRQTGLETARYFIRNPG